MPLTGGAFGMRIVFHGLKRIIRMAAIPALICVGRHEPDLGSKRARSSRIENRTLLHSAPAHPDSPEVPVTGPRPPSQYIIKKMFAPGGGKGRKRTHTGEDLDDLHTFRADQTGGLDPREYVSERPPLQDGGV